MTDYDKKNPKSKDIDKDAAGSVSKESGRRKLLKAGGIVASSALVPEKWQKPVVDSIILPAHAQTSTVLIGAVVITRGSVMPTDAADSMLAESGLGVLDTIIQPASAGAQPLPPPCQAFGKCARVGQPDSSNKVAFAIDDVDGSTMLIAAGGLTYNGNLNGIAVTNTFTDKSFTASNGSLSGKGCSGLGYDAVLGGSCTPTPSGSPAPTPSPSAPTPSPSAAPTPSPSAPTPSPSAAPTPSPSAPTPSPTPV